MDNVRLGIIGFGRLGRQHAENIHARIPHAELAAVCSVVDEELATAERELAPRHLTTDYHELIEDDRLDGILIASSSQQHARMVCDALKAGRKNLYVEKPLGMNLEEIEAIREAVEASGEVRLQLGYNRRFDRSLIEARKRIAAGFIGRPIQVRMINRDPASMAEFIIKFSPQSGGLVLDMLTHDYDCARWLVGSEATSVYGLGGVFVYEGLAAVGDIDNCSLLTRFESGVFGQIETSRNCPYGYHVETEIYGSEGCIRVGTSPARDRVTYMNRDGVTVRGAEWFFEYWEPTFLAEIREFCACISEGRSPAVGFEDGYRAVEWAAAATEAVREQREVAVPKRPLAG